MTLAEFISRWRERRGLTLRQLETKAGDLDHAYIWRLEKGDRDKPSQETIERLASALKLTRREKDIFLLLARQEIEDSLYQVMQSRLDIDWSYLEPAATMSFRGQRPRTTEEWLKVIEFLKDL